MAENERYWEEIDELPKELACEIFFVDDKFKAPLMGGHIVFHGFDIKDLDCQVNRGWHVTKDNKEIWRFNGKYWENDGEEKTRSIMQKVLGIRCCERYKSEVVNWVKDVEYIQIERTAFDNSPELIGMENGIYNMETKEFEEHMPYHMLTSIIPVCYDPNAKCPKFIKFIKEVAHPEDIDFLQEYIGYCFYRKYTWAIFVLLLGHGRNGKTTLIKILTDLLGDQNVEHLPLHKLAYDDFARVRLYRKWANLCADIESYEIKKTGILKELTGNDPIFARRLYKEGFNFVNVAKLMFASNELPVCLDKTFAMEERFAVIEFPNEFPRDGPECDPFLYEKLKDELSGIFNWAMEGLERLLKNKTFSEYKTLENVKSYLSTTKDMAYQFIEKNITYDVGNTEFKDDVYQRYVSFASEKNQVPMRSNHFSAQFKRYVTYYFRDSFPNFVLIDGWKNKKRVWKGIKLKGILTKSKQERI